MSEQKFVNGLFVNRQENAPEFVKASLSFNEKFIDYLKGNFNAKGYCNIDILESKGGKLYAKLNDFKPKSGVMKENEVIDIPEEPEDEEIKVENIPFG